MDVKKILVLCTGNSCRSQMAEGFLRHYGEGRVEAYSAGTESHGLNPNAVTVMREIGIDIASHRSEKMDKYLDDHFDFVITVCDEADENCPYFPGDLQRFHQDFDDPAKATGTDQEIMDVFRTVRDQVDRYCSDFLELHP